MFLIAAFLLILASVPPAGGRLSRLTRLPLRRVWLVHLALGLQIVIINVVPGADPTLLAVVHVLTYAVAGAFVVLNRAIPGVALIGLGGLLNVMAITANAGVMPASPAAVEAAGIEHTAGEFENSVIVEDARLAPLGDVFAIPEPLPLANVFSVGDVAIAAGAAIGVHAATGTRLSRRRPAALEAPAA